MHTRRSDGGDADRKEFVMDDHINRQAAIAELMQIVEDHRGDRFNGELLHYTGLKAMLECLPAADVRENKSAHWIGYPECLEYPNAYADHHILCSECEECFSILSNDCDRFCFLPSLRGKDGGGI